MGQSRLSLHGTTAATAANDELTATQRSGSGVDIWLEVTPGEASKRAGHGRKSVTVSHDQLLYLQALYPYAGYDELMTVINNTDDADEAATRAYEALNPDYSGFTYLKEQHDLLTNPKRPSAQRATAFAGLRESLQERAADAFRPGHFGNLSQLQEYEETVGLFIVDTSDWDRATLLPSRDLAEVAFMDLPLREESTTYGAATTTIDGSRGSGSERRREGQSRSRISLAMSNSASDFKDLQPNSMLHAVNNAAPLSQSLGKTGKSSHEQARGAADERSTGERNGGGEDNATASVVYQQDSDPPRAAPIIAWAPQAIRVGPAEARQEREMSLRVFDEASFFKDPLLRVAVQSLPLNGARGHLDVSPLNGAVAAPSVEEDEVHEPALSALANGQTRDKAALSSPRRSFSLSVEEGNESHEPAEPRGTSVPNPGSDGIREGKNNEQLFSVEVPPTSHSHSRTHTNLPAACVRTRLGASARTADGTTNGTRRFSGDCGDVSSSNALHAQHSMRNAAREALNRRKPHPLTTSEKVRERLRSLSPVGNLIFRETSLQTPALLPQHEKGLNRPSSVTRSSELAPTRAAAGEEASAPSIITLDTQRQRAAYDGWANMSVNGGNRADRDVDELHTERQSNMRTAGIPAAHRGCSSLDPAAFLNAEEERWDTIVTMLAPYEEVFGSKSRCELVRCIHDECPNLHNKTTIILQRLLHVVGKALRGKQVLEGMTEEPLEVPLLGPILLSTSPLKLTELSFREDKCSIEFCEEGTRMKAKLNIKAVALDSIQFAYIGEANAARQARIARQAQRQKSMPGSRVAAWTLRGREEELYTKGVTRGVATIKATNIRLKGKMYVWLMPSGNMHIAFEKLTVSVGSFRLTTTVTKLNVFCTLGAPILRLLVQRGMEEMLQGLHSL
ncbi:hypothetical protein, conserved [Leishmania lindenbergi]|uniref:DnaJ domain family protein n=1 Tax=Leishmania lindenbergi TaxID=651832 RepID=A0AAW3AAE8_9TRYP